MTRVAWGTLGFVAALVGSSARAQTEPDAPLPAVIAGVAVSPGDDAVLDELDGMLPRPTVRRPPGGARSRDDYVVLATSLTERFVVVVDLRRRRVYAFEPRAQRVVDRAVASDVLRSPYAVAGIAFELLELIGFETDEPAPPPPRDPPPVVDAPPVDPPDPPAVDAPAPVERFDGVEFGVGVLGAIGLADEPRIAQLAFGVDVVLGLGRSPRRLLVGVFGSALGRERVSSSQGNSTGELTYRRPDLGARIGLGRPIGKRLRLVGALRFGVGFGAIDLVTETNGMSDPRMATARWVGGFVGVGGSAIVPIHRGLTAAVHVSLDTLVAAHDYSGAAGSEFHESPVRLHLALTLGWGSSSLGRGD